MKRATTMLGALALMTAGFLFAAPAAHANLPGPGTYNGVTCSYFSNSTGNYPGNNHFLKCVSSTQKTNNVFGTVFGETSYVKDKLNNANITYYFFHSMQDYEDYFVGAGYGAYQAPAGVHGFSVVGVTEPYSVVLEGQVSGAVFLPYDGVDLENTTAHETGHHLDYLWRNSLNNPASMYVSENGKKFDDQLAHDIFLLNNKKSGSNWVTRQPCGSGGALVNLHDPAQGGQTVCNGSSLRSGYSGTNWQIVQAVLPYHFSQQQSQGRWSETFAETFAKISGNTTGTGSTAPTAGAADAMLGNEFGCIRSYVSYLRLHGTEPTSYSTNCSMTLP